MNTGHVDPAMRHLPFRVGSLLVLLLLSLPASAVRVEDLYRAEVEVVDKGSEARTEGFRTALEQVLVKVAGDSGILSDPALEPVLEAPARFVQQYRYQPIERADDEAAAGGEDAEPLPAYRLEVMFGQSQVERELRAREITVWGPYRPQVLVWLAHDDGRRRGLVAADDEGEIDETLQRTAARRGLPLLLPLLDTEDRGRVDYLDVQGGFLDTVREASQRYRAGLVLVGHVYRAGDGWRGEWTLLEADGRRGWLTRADSADAAVDAGIGGLADRLATELAGRDGERSRVRVRVLDTRTLNDYARLGQYFERLPRVEAGRVVRVRPEEILFELELRGALADLERAITVGGLLVPARGDAAGDATATGDDAGDAAGGADSDPAADPGGEENGTGPGVVGGGDGGPDGPVTDGPLADDPTGGRQELVYRLVG